MTIPRCCTPPHQTQLPFQLATVIPDCAVPGVTEKVVPEALRAGAGEMTA